MKLAVSNIAWTNEEEPEVAELLQKLGVKYIEIAPTKLWEDPTKAADEQIEEYLNFWRGYGIEVVAFQSMLFTRPDLKIFENETNRAATQRYLQDFIGLAGKMGAGVMVFGSPKNRQKGDRGEDEARAIAKTFFDNLGSVASAHNTCFCIEPNASQYACDFITTAEQGISFVREVANPGFGLHLDIACMTLAGDDVASSITNSAGYLKHFHVSSPMLEDVEDRADINHRAAAEALSTIGYDGFVSIEMRPSSDSNLERVRAAVTFAQSVYSS